jgi:hypothetical protein
MCAVKAQYLDLRNGRHPGGARPIIQHRHFPEYIARLRGFENDLLAFIVSQEDFNLAGTDDIERVAGIAEVEDSFSGGVAQ